MEKSETGYEPASAEGKVALAAAANAGLTPSSSYSLTAAPS
jgi:hypothetical protein